MTAAMSRSKKDAMVKIIIFAILIAIVSAIAFYLSSTVDELEKKHSWLKNDIAEMNRKIEGMNKKSLEFSEGVKVWEALPDSDKSLTGLRINEAKDVLDKLQTKYGLANVKTSFSKPENIEGDFKSDTVALVSSTIAINFSTQTDEDIYNFILDMVKSFPGYVQIKSISIGKPAVIDKESIRKIASGESINVFSVNMDFYWHDLKYKGPAKDPNAPPAPVEAPK